MNSFKKLAGDTFIYGVSSIVGRFMNWWLMPLYISLFRPEIYGVVTNLYSYVAFFMVFLTYGMETGFFRFASKSNKPKKVYSTSLLTLFSTSLLFVVLVLLFKNEIATTIQYQNHPEYIVWLAIILGIDAITAIPFARLRLNNKPIKFALIKLINITCNIGLNLFFLLLCPKILAENPTSFVQHIYSQNIGVGYVFIANLLASLLTLILLFPDMLKLSFKYDKKLIKSMLKYSLPILIVGLAGITNQHIDKILIPFLIPEDQNPMEQLGIYGSGVKIAVLMNMFIQAFRYAFEPFFFSKGKGRDDKNMHAKIMKYFVVFCLLIFLGMVLFIDIIKLIITKEDYQEGFAVVPIILMANLFLGIYYVLSMWYKLTDKTKYGAYISVIGSLLTIILNFVLIPIYGYFGSAVAVLFSFFLMMVSSYLLGQKHYPIPYNVKRIGAYFVLAISFYGVSFLTNNYSLTLKYIIHATLLALFLLTVFMLEKNELKNLFKPKK